MNPKRMWTLGLILVLTLAAGSLLTTRAASITVDTTNDVLDAAGACNAVTLGSLPGPDGVTSLREAMCAANVNPGADTIEFDISGCGSGCTILPTVALPILTDDSTTIDGYSQNGASPATGAAAATILVQIDGSLVAANNGINIASTGNLVRGLAINRFPWNGVAIGGTGVVGNTITGNHIGLDLTGMVDLGNGFDGIFIGLGAQNNLVGGDEPAERNVISGNELEGIAIHGSETAGNIVSGNYIGTSADGLAALANTLAGMRIYGGGHNNTIGGDTEGEKNIISGNLTEGVLIEGEEAIDNVISGNYIGTDVTGMAALPNLSDGIELDSAIDNLVGGDEAGERNVISGNSEKGIYINGSAATGNVVSGNYIGVDVTGATALPNDSVGVQVASPDNLIGGDSPGARNVISGNGDDGVYINGWDGTDNVVSGNFIGVDATGAVALPNQDDGVTIAAGRNNLIGGISPEARNVISGNGDDGVVILYNIASGNIVSGNYLGVDAGGNSAIPNINHGVFIDLGAHHNEIGGDTVGARNVISGNGGSGVGIGGLDPTNPTEFNNVLNNYIGVAADGTTALGNGRSGVHFSVNAPDNFIGPYNIIAYNGWDGVAVDTPLSVGNIITNNSIFSNGDLGIDLTNGGNNQTPAPTILSAPSGPGVITGAALPGSVVQVFTSRLPDGEGEIHLGTTVAGGAGDYTLPVTHMQYPYLTATATDSTDGTSEFSALYVAAVPVLHEDSNKSVHRETISSGGLLTYTLALTNTGTATASATLTDTLSTDVTWNFNASTTSGVLVWEAAHNRLVWNGSMDEGATVVITFQVQVNDDLPEGTIISNAAQVDSGSGYVFELHAPDVTVVDRKLYLPLIRR